MRGWVLLPVLAVACGGTGTAPPKPPPEPAPVAVATTTSTALAPEKPALRRPDVRYAPSALTALAESVTQLVATVIDGHPPPPGPLPLERRRNQDKLVRGDEGAPRSRDLDFLGVAFELDLVLVPDDPTLPRPAGDVEPDGTLRTIAFVGPGGLKVASLDVQGPRPPRPLAGWLGGAEEHGKNVLDALRSGRLGELLMGEPERALFANDQVWREVEKELPKAEEQARAQALARAHPRPAGYRMDDIIVMARDARGSFWGFALQVDEDDGQAVLDSHPLVRIQKLDPNRGF
jgi:hypothetical protein